MVSYTEQRLEKVMKKLVKSNRKLGKSKSERIWIEKNPNINIINYPFYKLKKVIFGKL